MQTFRELAERHKLADYKPEDKIYIAFGDMETEIKVKTVADASTELNRLKELFPQACIEKVFSLHNAIYVFCTDTEALKTNEANGTELQISRYCSEAVAQYDSFCLFGGHIACLFFSDEELMSKYGGNFFAFLSAEPQQCLH